MFVTRTSPARTAALSAAFTSPGPASLSSMSKQSAQPLSSAFARGSGVLPAPRSSSNCSSGGVTSGDRQCQWPSAIRHPRRRIAPAREGVSQRHSNHSGRPQSAGRCGPRPSGHWRRRPTVEQQPGFLGVLQRIHQRGSATIILHIRVRALRQQKTDGFGISVERRIHNRCPAALRPLPLTDFGLVPYRAIELLTIAVAKGVPPS